MTRAIICLPNKYKSILSGLFACLSGFEIKVFGSISDGFEYLWSEGREVGVFLVDIETDDVDELWDTARNWPNLYFIVLHDELGALPTPLVNMVLVPHQKASLETLKAISDCLIPRIGSLRGK